MKDKIKNNIGFKIAAVLFAILLWWAVVNIDDPINSKKYVVNVTVTNPEVITNAGKSYQILDDTRNVTVTVKARRKVLDEIKMSNIIATADLREMQDTSVPIRIQIQGFEGLYEEVSSNPRNIQVQTETIQKKTFPITASYYGTPRDGYVVGNMIAEPKTVDISGPESTINKISKVVAKVDVSEMSKDAKVEATLIYYDAADNIIDQSLLSSNCDKKGVTVSVIIWKTRDLTLQFDTTEIKPAAGYVFTGIEVEPQTIEVAASSDILGTISKLEIGPEVLARPHISETEEVVIEITEHLPEGINLVGDNTGVVVRIMIEEAGTKSILLPVGAVTVTNAPEDLQLTYGPAQEIELKFEGSTEVLAGLTNEKIIAAIDLASYTKEGTYEVAVQITDLPKQCTYIGEATIEIILSPKTE